MSCKSTCEARLRRRRGCYAPTPGRPLFDGIICSGIRIHCVPSCMVSRRTASHSITYGINCNAWSHWVTLWYTVLHCVLVWHATLRAAMSPKERKSLVCHVSPANRVTYDKPQMLQRQTGAQILIICHVSCVIYLFQHLYKTDHSYIAYKALIYHAHYYVIPRHYITL